MTCFSGGVVRNVIYTLIKANLNASQQVKFRPVNYKNTLILSTYRKQTNKQFTTGTTNHICKTN